MGADLPGLFPVNAYIVRRIFSGLDFSGKKTG
jgi:hypothetical protein